MPFSYSLDIIITQRDHTCTTRPFDKKVRLLRIDYVSGRGWTYLFCGSRFFIEGDSLHFFVGFVEKARSAKAGRWIIILCTTAVLGATLD